MLSHRYFTYTLFWVIFSFVIGSFMFLSYRLISLMELASSVGQGERVAISVLIPVGLAMYGFAHSALMSLVNRGLIGDSELGDLACEEADRFKAALLMFLRRDSHSDELVGAVSYHLEKTSNLEKQIWVKARRERVLSHWKFTAEIIFSECMELDSSWFEKREKAQLLLQSITSKSGCWEESKVALQRVCTRVDTLLTPKTTKPAQGGLSH